MAVTTPIVLVDNVQATYVGLSAFIPPIPPVPSLFADALMGVRMADFDGDQSRVLLDFTGGGLHLWFGVPTERDAVLGPGRGGGGKLAVQASGVTGRGVGIPNIGQALNVGAAGETLRVTLNFAAMMASQDQTILGHAGSANTVSWSVGLLADGRLTATISQDGTAARSNATTILLSTVFNDFEDAWVRVTFDFGASTINYETSVDGVVWDAFEGPLSWGAALASAFQPDASVPVEIGSSKTATVTMATGAVLFFAQMEENAATAWTFDAETIDFNLELVPVGVNAGASHASDPVVNPDFLRITRNVSELRSYQDPGGGQSHALEDLLDIAPGEVFTLIIVAAMASVQAGAGSFHTPLGKKNTGAAGNPGWVIENDGNLNGFDWRASSGAVQSVTPLGQIVNDDELAGTIYEVDGPDGEIRMRKLGVAPVVAAYANQGSGTNFFGLMVGRTGTFGFGMDMDFYGLAIWKRELTDFEMGEAVAYLSDGAL